MLARGEEVIGIDNLNSYYDVKLKGARLSELQKQKGFTFHKLDIANEDAMAAFGSELKNTDRIIHLAAQAGVRYSLCPWKGRIPA